MKTPWICPKCRQPQLGFADAERCLRSHGHAELQAIRLAPSTVDVASISEYGLRQKLSNSIRCF